MTVREILKILHNDGWVKKDCKGSHIQLSHQTKSGKVTVPNHTGDVPTGTLDSIMKQAGLK